MKNTFFHDISYSKDSAQYSSSKVWFNISNLAILAVYLVYGIRLALAEPIPTNIEGLIWFSLVVSAIVTGNKIANLVIKKKYGGSDVVGSEASKK